MTCVAKAAVNRTQSRRSAKFADPPRPRPRRHRQRHETNLNPNSEAGERARAAGTVRALRTGTLGGVFKMRSAAVLGRSRDLSTGGLRRFLTASPFGDLLRPRTGALRSDDLPILKTPPRKPSVRAGFPRGRGKLRPGRARSPSPRRRREKSSRQPGPPV